MDFHGEMADCSAFYRRGVQIQQFWLRLRAVELGPIPVTARGLFCTVVHRLEALWLIVIVMLVWHQQPQDICTKTDTLPIH
jgi:hypothetical protein